MKKCIPITLSGCFVAHAISVIESEDVLVANIAFSEQISSNLENNSFLIFILSDTASITKSASFASAIFEVV